MEVNMCTVVSAAAVTATGAGFQGRAEIADLLIAHGLSVHEMHTDGYTPFHRACWGIELRHTDTVETFLNNGVEGTLLAENGKSCLDMTSNKHTKKLIRTWLSEQESKKTAGKKKDKKSNAKAKAKTKNKKQESKKGDL
jgi:ankyrin repeat protein